jgi:hypothetical protein
MVKVDPLRYNAQAPLLLLLVILMARSSYFNRGSEIDMTCEVVPEESVVMTQLSRDSDSLGIQFGPSDPESIRNKSRY